MARQRGAIIRRGKSYYIKYRTPAGKQKWESGFSNRSQAQQRLNQLLGEIGHGSYVEPKGIKFETFAEEWLESRVAVRGSTLSSYGSIVRHRLIPHFGKMRLSEIGYDQVQNFVNELSKEVSIKTLHNVIICLRVMLVGKKGTSAVKRGFLRHDPTRGVEMPTKIQTQIVPPTPEEVWKLVDAGEELGGPGRDMIFVDAFTGLRRNEILALQYADVNWTNKELVINKAVSMTKVADGVRKWEWRIGPPKSRKSNRRVGAAEVVLELLRRLRASAKDPSGLVFSGPDGKRIDPDYFDESSSVESPCTQDCRTFGFMICGTSSRPCSSPRARAQNTFATRWATRASRLPSTPMGTSFRTHTQQQQRSCNKRCSQEGKTGLVAVW